jgi:uncharacterized protein (DUF2141 family)
MTLFNIDTSSAPAACTARHFLAAASALSLMGVASFASAQASAPESASDQQTATEAEPTHETPAAPIEDKFKPRVYGGATPTVTSPAPVPTPAPSSQSQPTAIVTLPATEPVEAEQQVNVIKREFPATPADAVAIPDVNPGLMPNSALNSAPNWPNAIRAQFVEVIVGAPIMVDPVSCESESPSLRIKVSNVKKSKGIIVADLHDDVKENFLDWEKVVLRVRATAIEGETSFCMPVPTTGKYAVAVYHDKNSNAFFDKNFLGLPKERFGMSNNPKFTTKSPKFEQAIFNVPADGVDMEIKLRRTSDVISGKQD